MALPSRQERLQMRQRGAGIRKVTNVDFGFSFGTTPGRAQKSTRQTPRPSSASSRRTSKTPSRSVRQSSARRSIRSASATVESGRNKSKSSVDLAHDRDAPANELAAERKTEESGSAETPAATDHPQSSSISTDFASSDLISRNSRSRRRTSGPAFVQIAEDAPDEVVQETSGQDDGVERELVSLIPGPELISTTFDKENILPDEDIGDDNNSGAKVPKRKTKKRRSIGQQSGRRKKRLSQESDRIPTEEPILNDISDGSFEEEQEWETMIGDGSILSVENISNSPTQQADVAKRRRKRKSIVLKPRKRKRSGGLSMQTATDPLRQPHVEAGHVSDTTEQLIQVEPTRNHQYSSPRLRRPARTSEVPSPTHGPGFESEVEADTTYIDEAESPEKPTPKAQSKKAKATTRKGRRPRSDASSGPAAPSRRATKSSRSTFPILTHRMTNVAPLANIAEEGEDDLDTASDPTSRSVECTGRSAPNAVDVLAQICRETILATTSTISTTWSAASTRELKRKRTAIEAFASEIDSRLFDMSVAVEHRLATEARAKKAKKAKLDAQNEWMELRRQREDVALKCDDIRVRNLMIEAEGKEKYQLSEQLHKLEMIVDKPELGGEVGDFDDLEYRLRSVANTVSSAEGGRGGLLAQLKEYNLQLERTALVLEGRHVD